MSKASSPVLSWKTRISLSIYSYAVDLSRRSNFTVNRRLMSFFDPKASTNSSNGVSSSDITFDSSRNLWFRIYAPTTTTNTSKLPLIVFFHGGGFAYMAANSLIYDDFCRRLSRDLPAVVVSVNYRLSPEHKFPAQHDDGFDALKFIDAADCLPKSADLSRCFLAGDSAGGNIAHHTALRTSGEEFGRVRIRGVIAVQPFFGGEERTESEIGVVGVPLLNVDRSDWMWKAWLPSGSDRDHGAVNVFGPNAMDISDLEFPRAIVFVGGFDPLQDWQRRYYEGLKRSGKECRLVEYPNAIHGFYAVPDIPESTLFINEVKQFVMEQEDGATS